MAGFIDDISINTIIGQGCFVHGGLEVPGFLRVDGDIDGDISTPGRIVIGENARIRGNIHAKSVSIGGMVKGDIIAYDNVVALPTALIVGGILTRRLRIDENVLLEGFCAAINDPQAFEKAERDYKNKLGLVSSSFAESAADA